MRSILLALFVATPLAAQNPPTPQAPAPPGPPRPAAPAQRDLRAPVADTGIFAPAPLPAANDIRRGNGAPGKAYWQQRADYSIRATLDTAKQRIDGSVTIRYTNNSPDTLTRVWLQMDQNLFKQGSVGSFLNGQDTRFGGAGFDGGFEISKFTMALGPARRGAPAGAPKPVKTRTDDTMMDVSLPTPLPPGGVAVGVCHPPRPPRCAGAGLGSD